MDFEKNREWATEINEKLEHSDPSSIVDYFENLERRWKLDNDISNCFISVFYTIIFSS